VPFGLTVDAVSTSRPSLTWMSGGPDALSGFDHYQILRNGLVVGTSATESFTDSLLAQNGVYVYTVRSVDHAGATSAASPPRTAIWDDTPPAPPQDVASPNPTNLPVLTWPAVSDTGGANGVVYHVFRDGIEIGWTPLATFTDSRTTTRSRTRPTSTGCRRSTPPATRVRCPRRWSSPST
jgi:hypothetical protein